MTWCFTCEKYVKDKKYDKCKSEKHDLDYENNYDGPQKEERVNEIKNLIKFAQDKIIKTVVSNSDSSKVYVLIPINGHVETFDLSRGGTRRWLKSAYYNETNEIYSDELYKSVLDLLLGIALNDDTIPREIIYIRIAMVGDVIYYDLCSPKWECVKVSKKGCEIIKIGKYTPMFARTQHQYEQVKPNFYSKINGLSEFSKLVKINDELFQTHIVTLFLEKFSMPIMALAGEQGSLKSTISSSVKRIVDPSGNTTEANTAHMQKRFR